jgi:hypothetical protein
MSIPNGGYRQHRVRRDPALNPVGDEVLVWLGPGYPIYPAKVDMIAEDGSISPTFRREVADEFAWWLGDQNGPGGDPMWWEGDILVFDAANVFDDREQIQRCEPDNDGRYPIAAAFPGWFGEWQIVSFDRPIAASREVYVSLSEGPAFPAIVSDNQWNGFEQPAFRREVAQRIGDWINAQDNLYDWGKVEWEGDVFVFRDSDRPARDADSEEDWEPLRFSPDADGRYHIGAAYWTWMKYDPQQPSLDEPIETHSAQKMPQSPKPTKSDAAGKASRARPTSSSQRTDGSTPSSGDPATPPPDRSRREDGSRDRRRR